MIELLPHQQLLAEKLAAWTGSRPAVVRAPVGSGAGAALIPFIADAAAGGWVLIAAPSRLLLDQWTERLRDAGLQPRFLNAGLTLELADSSGRSTPNGLALATYARLSRRAARQAVIDLPVALFVIDGAPVVGGQHAGLDDLAAHARRTMVLTTPTGPSLPAWLQDYDRIEITMNEVRTEKDAARTRVLTRPVRRDPSADSLLGQAAELLGWSREQIDLASRATVYESLLRLAVSAANGDDQRGEAEVSTAWRLIDSIEELDTDPRLTALLEVVSELRATGRPTWIMTSPLVSDAEYVHDFLQSAGIAAVLATSHSVWQRPEMAPLFGVERPDLPPLVIVATPSALERLPLRETSGVIASVPFRETDWAILRTLLARGAPYSVTAIVNDGTGNQFVERLVGASRSRR